MLNALQQTVRHVHQASRAHCPGIWRDCMRRAKLCTMCTFSLSSVSFLGLFAHIARPSSSHRNVAQKGALVRAFSLLFLSGANIARARALASMHAHEPTSTPTTKNEPKENCPANCISTTTATSVNKLLACGRETQCYMYVYMRMLRATFTEFWTGARTRA